jgi:hypothetical protein
MPETSLTLITDKNPNYHYKGMLRGLYFWRRTFARIFFQRKLGEVKHANNDCYDPKKFLATKKKPLPARFQRKRNKKIKYRGRFSVWFSIPTAKGEEERSLQRRGAQTGPIFGNSSKRLERRCDCEEKDLPAAAAAAGGSTNPPPLTDVAIVEEELQNP